MEIADTKIGYPAPGAPRRAPGDTPRPTLVATMVAKVASNARASLAIIAVLVILVVGMYVHYHGFLFLGPYAKRAARRGAKGVEKSADAGGDNDKGDSETERLIESINKA